MTATPNPGGNVYKREGEDRAVAWNQVIRDVNELAENPDPGCDPLEPLEEVESNHIWIKGDVQEVQDLLMEICPENEFEDIPDYWLQSIVDEIDTAIENGWCDCKKCQGEDERISLLYHPQLCSATLYVYSCTGFPGPCYEYSSHTHFDWYTAASAIAGYGEGIGGGVAVKFSYVRDGGITGTNWLYNNTFDCAGNQKLPLPTRPTGGECCSQNLSHSTVGDLDNCYACSVYEWSCFLWWCVCSPCGGGTCGRCCATAPTEHPCDCELDEGYVYDNCSYYRNHKDACASHTYALWWYADKSCPPEFHGEGGTCRKCCSDGIGFCPWDCPGDPACD